MIDNYCYPKSIQNSYDIPGMDQRQNLGGDTI